MSLDDYEESGASEELEDEDDVEKPETDIEVGPVNTTMICSDEMRKYFEKLTRDADKCYQIAQEARRKGLDPSLEVEIPRAQDLAARVEALVGPPGVGDKIRELSKKFDREQVALHISKQIAKDMVDAGASREKAVDQAVRTGLATLTEGVLVAPLEGIIQNGIKIGKNSDGTDFLAVYYAGPIRSAGGTGQALSVLIADFVRRELGIGAYIATFEEIERLKEEIPAYKQEQHLQYTPNSEEIESIAKGCPIMITGEATERGVEVSGYRDQPRIETNGIRGGACLVIAEGLCLKAPKVQKHVKKLGIGGWEFIDRFVAKGKGDAGPVIIKASDKYLEKTLAGRPILAHPSKKGGLRLRYGRARTAGIASTALHPSLMFILDDFIAVGTQIALERPGKATIATPCDEIDAPIVLLKNGDLVQLDTTEQAKKLSKEVKRIIDMGELLVPFGEFAENNKNLVDSPYCTEWFEMEFEKKTGTKWSAVSEQCSDARAAFSIAEKCQVPLHPKHLLFWHDVSKEDLRKLSDLILANGKIENGRLRLPSDIEAKNTLIELCALHEASANSLLISERYSYPLIRGCGLEISNDSIVKTDRFQNFDTWSPPPSDKLIFPTVSTLQLVNLLSGVDTRARGIYRIGGRMGRPEKASARMMKPAPHILFPVGNLGGPQRLLFNALESLEEQGAGNEKLEAIETKSSNDKPFKVEIGMRKCQNCGTMTYKYKCRCGGHTIPSGQKMVDLPPNLKDEVARAESVVGYKCDDIKGVKGVISDGKAVEPIEKGIIRARYKIHTFKDGTARFDMTDAPLTHFRPREIGTSAAKLRQMGYAKDFKGEPLERDDQLLELKAQDVIPSLSCGQYMVSASKVVDDMLVKLYGMEAFYNAKEPQDLVGELVIGLAPHTSAGILGRLIGYTDTQMCYAHPFYHTGKRRNCDGDGDALMLLMDGLVNFSKSYLPSTRGGLMDAPLVLATNIDPHEIDKESHNVDVSFKYPLEFYEATLRHSVPKEVEGMMRTVGSLLGKPEQYEGFGFTHDTRDISEGIKRTSYATLGSMQEKVDAQFGLGEKLRSVDTSDLAARVIEKHFLPDMIGNLKKFSTQETRCTKCGAKYRRVPLIGTCKCGNKLILTVSEGSVKKYFDMAEHIASKYGVSNYMQQRLNLLRKSADTIFQKQAAPKKCTISDFL